MRQRHFIYILLDQASILNYFFIREKLNSFLPVDKACLFLRYEWTIKCIHIDLGVKGHLIIRFSFFATFRMDFDLNLHLVHRHILIFLLEYFELHSLCRKKRIIFCVGFHLFFKHRYDVSYLRSIFLSFIRSDMLKEKETNMFMDVIYSIAKNNV